MVVAVVPAPLGDRTVFIFTVTVALTYKKYRSERDLSDLFSILLTLLELATA